METTSELKQLLKALRLSSLLTTLPERVAHNAHQMIIEGESYRKKKGTSGSKL
jgi:hypothetical protein